MSSFQDISGRTFGRLLVIKRMDNDKWGKLYWLCRCDCGKEKIIVGQSLKSGNTKSCGCLQKEVMDVINKNNQHGFKHGHAKNRKISKTYSTWNDMIQRCINPKNKFYRNYGGRGITVCKRWRKFENFLEDMGESPSGHQIDRIDNNGHYCLENCRWSTRKEQNRNKRDNTLLTYGRKTQCLAAWAEEIDIKAKTLASRLRTGWSKEKALTTPVCKKGKK